MLNIGQISDSIIQSTGQAQDFITKSLVVDGGRWLGWFKNPVSSQTEKLMAGTKFSDYLGLNHYKKAKKIKHFIHLRLTNRPQSFGS